MSFTIFNHLKEYATYTNGSNVKKWKAFHFSFTYDILNA